MKYLKIHLVLYLVLAGFCLKAQDIIYYKKNKTAAWKVTEITSGYIKGRDIKNPEVAYSIGHPEVLFIFNNMGNFLVVPKLYDSQIRADYYINNFLKNVNNGFNKFDRIITTRNNIITGNYVGQTEKTVEYTIDNQTRSSIPKSDVAVIIYKNGSHQLFTTVDKAYRVLKTVQDMYNNFAFSTYKSESPINIAVKDVTIIPPATDKDTASQTPAKEEVAASKSDKEAVAVSNKPATNNTAKNETAAVNKPAASTAKPAASTDKAAKETVAANKPANEPAKDPAVTNKLPETPATNEPARQAAATKNSSPATKPASDSTATAVKTPAPAEKTAPADQGAAKGVKELDAAVLKSLQEKAILNIKELETYIKILSNKETAPDDATKTIEQAIALFVNEDATFEVSSINRSTVQQFKVRPYLIRLGLMKYDKVMIEWYNVQYASKVRMNPDGTYSGIIEFEQRFTGISGDRKMYEDITRKTVEIILKTYNKNKGGQVTTEWDVFLGNIGITVTKPA